MDLIHLVGMVRWVDLIHLVGVVKWVDLVHLVLLEDCKINTVKMIMVVEPG